MARELKKSFEGNEKPIKIPIRTQAQKNADLEKGLQTAETIQDGLTQKLMKMLGKNHPLAKDAFKVLIEIRKMQSRYFPVKSHSLLRYDNRYFDAVTGEKKAKELQPTKHNWKKWKIRIGQVNLDGYFGS